MLAALGLLLSFGLSPCSSQNPATNVRVIQVTKQFVAGSGESVIGVGSWISGKNYGDVLQKGLSDHDMRLVLPEGTTEQQAMTAWRNAQKELRALVQKEFGADAPKVLKTINLYPPSQLMQGIETAAEASGRFQELGAVPNLGYVGSAKNAPAKYVEGLYGAGSSAWTQSYEQSAGRLFYTTGNGKVYSGLTDLTHLSEGSARYTVEGMANTSVQWAEHAASEAAAGRGDKVAKQIARLERDLAKAKDLARIGADPDFRTQLHEIGRTLAKNPSKLSSLKGTLNSLLKRAQFEAELLSKYQGGTTSQRLIARLLLDSMSAKSGISKLITQAWDKVPIGKLVTGLFIYISLRDTARAAGESDYLTMLAHAAPWMVGLGPALLAHLTAAIITEAQSAGAAFVAGSQDAWDLMAGIYTAVAREGVDPGRAYTLDDLVKLFFDEQRLQALVRAKAIAASRRNIGGNTEVDDERAAEAIFQKCWPVILQAWRAKREGYLSEFQLLATNLKNMAVLLEYTPNPVVIAKGQTSAQAKFLAYTYGQKLSVSLARMEEIVKLLGGPAGYVSVKWDWVGGARSVVDPEPYRRTIGFDGPGVYPVAAVIQLRTGTTLSGAPSELFQTLDIAGFVDVDVVREEDLNKPAGKPEPPKKESPLGAWTLADVTVEEDGFKNQNPASTGGNNAWSGDAKSGTVVLCKAWGFEGEPFVSPLKYTVTHKWELPTTLIPRSKVLVKGSLTGIKYDWDSKRGRGYVMSTGLHIKLEVGNEYQELLNLDKGVYDGSPDLAAPQDAFSEHEFVVPDGRKEPMKITVMVGGSSPWVHFILTYVWK